MIQVKESKLVYMDQYIAEQLPVSAPITQSNLAVSAEPIADRRDTIKPDNNGNNDGGGNMKDYVTHEELNHVFDKLVSKIELSEAHTETKLGELSGKIDRIPDKISLALNEREKEQRKEHKETQRFLWGTIILGIASIIISVFF
jgi:hypothetical protein